ncbi:MAG: hypothetical protein J5737_03810 [Bacteroidales bacterium]|nr:hypothetical protein [Bacteroidales bacterium]
MKYIKTYLFALAFAALTLAACDKTEVPEYHRAAPTDGEQVFFPSSLGDRIAMAQGSTMFEVPIQRGSQNLEAVDVPITASGEGIEFFSVPGTVSFPEWVETVKIPITVKDLDALGMNNFHKLTLSIADEAMTTPYGRSSVTIEAGIELPWIKFDDGILYEVPYWGEEEEKVMEYQELSPTLRICRITECFGHDTIEGGGEYDVQDYIWYWNPETNRCYVPVQWMGYENKNGRTWFSDEPAFYNHYWAMKNGVGYGADKGYGNGAGAVEGTEDWFAFCDAFRDAYPEDYYPYYDGNGTFYLADQYIAGYPSDPDAYLGRYTGGGDADYFAGANFGDYTLDLAYEGMFVSPTLEPFPILSFTSTKKSSKFYDTVKYMITPQDANPVETLAAIAAGGEGVNTIVLKESYAKIQPAIEPGLYTLVAVPFVEGDKNDKGENTELKTLFAEALDFYFPGINAEPTDVECEAYLLAPDQVYGAIAAQYGYYSYNSICFYAIGKDITKGVTFLTLKETLDGYLESYGADAIIAAGSALDDEDLADINSEDGCAFLYGGSNNPLPASTNFGMLFYVENKFGSTKTFILEHATDPAPAGASVAKARMIKNPNQTNDLPYVGIAHGIDAKLLPVSQGWSKPAYRISKNRRFSDAETGNER